MERHHFQQELSTLKERLLAMGGLAEERVRTAMQGLVERDGDLIDEVLNGDMPVNELHIEIDDLCLKLLALHSPMAADLRAIMAAIKINSDLERVGDMAVNIAEAARRYASHPPVKKLIDIPRMATTAQTMLRDALDSYVRGDMQLAQHVLDEDDVLDSLKTQVFRELLTYMLQDPATIEPALDLILISRHLERIGDHATNVAEDVIFMVSGRDVRHHAGRLSAASSASAARSSQEELLQARRPSDQPASYSRMRPCPPAYACFAGANPLSLPGFPSAANAASSRTLRVGSTVAIACRPRL